jgi:hypothetical protein
MSSSAARPVIGDGVATRTARRSMRPSRLLRATSRPAIALCARSVACRGAERAASAAVSCLRACPNTSRSRRRNTDAIYRLCRSCSIGCERIRLDTLLHDVHHRLRRLSRAARQIARALPLVLARRSVPAELRKASLDSPSHDDAAAVGEVFTRSTIAIS